MKIKGALLSTALVLVLLGLGTAAWAEERFEAGGHYLELAAPPTLVEPGDGRPEVTLFFWYGCAACSLVDPGFTDWAANLSDDVAVRKLPTTYMEPWNMHARIFMTLEEMGREKELHGKIFEMFAAPGGMVRSEGDFEAFAQTLGLDPKVFAKTYASAAVDERMARLDEILKIYDPQVVPTIVVDGRYLTDLSRVEDPNEFLELVGHLLEKARAARAAGK